MHIYARSCIQVARHEMDTEGDLALARSYLERVAASNAEEVTAASELLRKLMAMMGQDAGAGEGMPAPEVVPPSAATTSTVSSGESAAPAPST